MEKRAVTIKFEKRVQELINKRESSRKEVKRLWREACKFDNIPPESSFVNFSQDNPFEPLYNEAMGYYLGICRKQGFIN